MNRVYELPLSPDYVRHWGVTEAEGQMVAVPTPQAILQAFFDQYGKYIPRLPKVAMKKLIERSKEWRLK